MKRYVILSLAAALTVIPASPAAAHWWNAKLWNSADRVYCQRLPSKNVWYAYWGC